MLAGQTRQPVTPADYGKFETLVAQPRGGLSPDGRWLAYGINRSNRENELRVTSIASGETKTIAFGSQPTFSADSRWAAYAIGYSEAQEEKLRQQKKPIHRKLGTLKLASGEMATVDGIESFAFNASGTHLAMKRYAPERKDAPDSPAPADEAPVGTTLIVRQLETGRDTTFGNVTEFTWQEKGGLLALAIGAEDKTGNGVQLYDPETGSLRVLDSAPAIYAGLTWRKDADDLAVLRSATDERHEGATHAVLAWKGLGPMAAYDPTSAAGFPAGSRIVSFRRPTWSDDGRTVFVGVAKWEEKAQEKGQGRRPGQGEGNGRQEARRTTRSPTSRRQSRSGTRGTSTSCRVRRSTREPIASGTRSRRGTSTPNASSRSAPISSSASPPSGGSGSPTPSTGRPTRWSARSAGRQPTSTSIDIDSGARTKVKDGIEDQYLQASPGGRYLLYFQADQYWTIDTATKATVNISKAAQTSFVNRESDATVKQKPAFGVAGWTKDDEGVVLYDKFDAWLVRSRRFWRDQAERRVGRSGPLSLRAPRPRRGVD